MCEIESMNTLSSLAGALTESLSLSQPPVAIGFADAVPPGVKLYDGAVPAGCQFWQHAAKGVFATVSHDHELCGIGIYTHNLETSPGQQRDLGDALKVFADLGYVREQDLPLIPVLNRKAKVVIYGSLSDIPVSPDVVLLFVRADQTLILSEASQQLENGAPPALGRPACGVVAQAFNTGRTALSLGCCGARAYLDILTPDVALYAVPGSILEAFTERVSVLAKANSILSSFHATRRRDVEAGKRPSVQDSLAAMQ
jgi:uncharacterized protein (DUF169 family)